MDMFKSRRLVLGVLALELILALSGFCYFKYRDPLRVGTWVRVGIYQNHTGVGVITAVPKGESGPDMFYWVQYGPPFMYFREKQPYFASELVPLNKEQSAYYYQYAEFKLPGED